MSLRKSSRRRNGSKSDVLPNPNARRNRTPAPSSAGLDLLSRLTGRIDIVGSPTQKVATPHETMIISKLLGGSCVRKHALIIHSKKKFWRSVDSGLRRSINRRRTTNEIYVAERRGDRRRH